MGLFKRFSGENTQELAQTPENAQESDDLTIPEPIRVDMAPKAIKKSTADPVTRETLLSALRVVPHLAPAARLTGLAPSAWYAAFKRDPELAALVEEAKQEAIGRAETEAFRRAVDGTPKGVYYQGDKVAEEVEYSDALLGKILSAHHPAYVKKSQVEGSIQHNLTWTQIMRIADGESPTGVEQPAIDTGFEPLGEEDL